MSVAVPLRGLPTAVACAWIERDGKILLTQRLAKTHLASLWEFPGGKLEAGETPAAALQRELREEIGIDSVIGEEIARTTFAYPQKTVELILLRVKSFSGELQAIEVASWQWVTPEWLRDNAALMPPADVPLIEAALHVSSSG